MTIERADNFMRSLGVEAYRVGGSVRDEVLGRRPKDADYVVFGMPLADLGEYLRDQRADWRKFAVAPLKLRDGRQAGWRVSAKGLGVIEIMLPRTDISTGPAHTDFEIIIDPNLPLEEDAKRRDFTFNALYKIVHEGKSSLVAGPNGLLYEDIIDPLGGLEDLQRRQIQVTYGNSFRDDPLRTLRAIRFVSVLGYNLSPETRAVMLRDAPNVTGLTANGFASGTVIDEMSKILMGNDVGRALRMARDTGVLGSLFPELAPMLGFDQGSRYHDLTTDEHTFKALETAAKVDAPLRVRWALLFHDAGKPESAWIGPDGRLHYYATEKVVVSLDGTESKVLTEDHEVVSERLWREAAVRVGATKDLREDVATLIRNHMVPVKTKATGVRVRRMRVQFGDDLLRDLLMHRVCDLNGKTAKVTQNHIIHVGKMEALRQEAQESKVPASTKELKIDGGTLIGMGIQPGPGMGQVLKEVLDEVVCQPDDLHQSREWQQDAAGRIATAMGVTSDG
jgi:tRNA nucleotidyltransferase (CCA-adding enzyme)